MTNTFIDLSKLCDPSTRDCLTAVRDQAGTLGMDFFVVGALVRILILDRYYNISTGVETNDIDIGITVIDWGHYEKLRHSLISTGSFTQDKKVYHRLWHNKYPVDLIPFGAVETPAGMIQWPPDQSIKMNVTGFQDALTAAIPVRLSDDLDVHFVSLPAMAVLKLIAWHDRHNEFPTKDAIDIAVLLKKYLNAGNDKRMFDHHADLVETADFDFEMAGARLLGRDMAQIMSLQTKDAVLEILQAHTIPAEHDRLVVAVADRLPGKSYEHALALLQNLNAGILDEPERVEQ